jgi:hypothetical protein
LDPLSESHLPVSVKEIEEIVRQTRDIAFAFANIYKVMDNIKIIDGDTETIDFIRDSFNSIVKYFGPGTAFDDVAKYIAADLVDLVEYQLCRTADALVANGIEWKKQADSSCNKTSKSRWRRFSESIWGDPEYEGKVKEGRQWFKAVKGYSKVHKAMPRNDPSRPIPDDAAYKRTKCVMARAIENYAGRLEPDEKPYLE